MKFLRIDNLKEIEDNIQGRIRNSKRDENRHVI